MLQNSTTCRNLAYWKRIWLCNFQTTSTKLIKITIHQLKCMLMGMEKRNSGSFEVSLTYVSLTKNCDYAKKKLQFFDFQKLTQLHNDCKEIKNWLTLSNSIAKNHCLANKINAQYVCVKVILTCVKMCTFIELPPNSP